MAQLTLVSPTSRERRVPQGNYNYTSITVPQVNYKHSISYTQGQCLMYTTTSVSHVHNYCTSCTYQYNTSSTQHVQCIHKYCISGTLQIQYLKYITSTVPQVHNAYNASTYSTSRVFQEEYTTRRVFQVQEHVRLKIMQCSSIIILYIILIT